MEDSSQDRPCEPPGRALVAPELGVPDSRDGAVNGSLELTTPAESVKCGVAHDVPVSHSAYPGVVGQVIEPEPVVKLKFCPV